MEYKCIVKDHLNIYTSTVLQVKIKTKITKHFVCDRQKKIEINVI